MDTDLAAQREQAILFVQERVDRAVRSGLVRIRVDDQSDGGESITVRGQDLLNFGSCGYLGLNVDPRLKSGAIEAIERYGPVFSSSTAYTAVDLYSPLESKLEEIFGGTILIPTTVTLGHLSVLPVLIGPGDLVLIDHQAHASVQLTSAALRGLGAKVVDVPHNDVNAIREALEASASDYRHVWHLADGIYSMFGDTAPVAEVYELLDIYPNFHIYYDDAHGVGWRGQHGKGHVLSEVPLHDRMVVIGSLAKSWGAGGAVLVMPNRAMADRVLLAGATFSFSGPLHPAEAGAAIAAADIHLSPERDLLERNLMAKIEYVRNRIIEHQLPAASLERTPIWFIRIGSDAGAIELGQRMMADGFYVNLSAFPVVPIGMEGIRFTTTMFQTHEHLESFMDALARHVPGLVVPMADPVDLR